MAWEDPERELLSRCVQDARTHQPINSGQLSRFYKALSICPSLSSKDLPYVDAKLSLDALSVAGRPPLDTTRRAESTLLELARNSLHDDVRGAAAHALADYWTLHPPTELTSARLLSRMETFSPPRRFHFAVLSGEPQDLDLAATLVSQAELHVDDLKTLQERILAQDVLDEPSLRLLEELYVNGSWLGRRILIRQLGPGHEELVPTLARVASRADPTTRRAVISALERIGHVSAEPILLSLLSDLEPGVLTDVVSALAELGTRACLPHLSELREHHPELSSHIDDAFARLGARFPVDARAGAISLAEEGPAGALSLANASPGDISLYRDVETKLSEQALVTTPQTALSSEAHWHRLVTGPRDVPLAFTMREIGIGRWGLSLVAWLIASATIVSFSITFAATIHGTVFALVFGALGSSHYPRRRRVLREGVPAYAELTDYVVTKNNNSNNNTQAHTYTFRYMDELEQTHEADLVFSHSVPKIMDDPLEPILFTEKGEIMLFDEVGHLTVAEHGTLASNSHFDMIGLLGPLLAIWATIYTLVSLFL